MTRRCDWQSVETATKRSLDLELADCGGRRGEGKTILVSAGRARIIEPLNVWSGAGQLKQQNFPMSDTHILHDTSGHRGCGILVVGKGYGQS